ncbi:Sensor protein CzcS precursor [compost metagenome]
MKNVRLSLRLGLTVSLMGAGLVIMLAALAVLALDHELNMRSERILARKMEQLQHTLQVDAQSQDLSLLSHAFRDLVLSHDNLNLTIFDAKKPAPIFSFGAPVQSRQLQLQAVGDQLRFESWNDSDEKRLLTASQLIQLPDGSPLKVLLSANRSDDEQLLGAYLRTTIITLPLLLLLIGMGAWWLVRHGLRPLEQFHQVATRICAQDLSHRLTVEKLPHELGELAHSINFMLNRLDKGVQQLSQFSDDLAHELRSPISNLMGKAQVTLSRDRPAQEYKAVLESSLEELKRLTWIITDMLFLAQVSHPAALVPFENVRLENEAERVVDLFTISAEEKRIRLQVRGRATVTGDRLMIQRALSNLLSNAIRHSAQNTQVDLEIAQHAELISVSVSNSGKAIPAEHLPHLFERFYRVDDSRSRLEGGTGLGLAIVHSIMALHQGSVEVKSVAGGLTVFRLLFARQLTSR